MEKAAVLIPARYASQRFPGKMLARDPRGRILVQYVCEAASAAWLAERVIVATDDERILRAVEGWGGEARMTSPAHRSGGDRIAEVAADLPECGIVVNVQGDEPQILPEQIDQAIGLLAESDDCDMSTLVCPIETLEELEDPNVVKCVFDAAGRALYFSRWAVPYARDVLDPLTESPSPHYRHLGIYAYRREFLLAYSRLGPCPLEEAEKLEQLRALYYGHRIRVGVTKHCSIGVDTPEDFEAFCRAVREEMAGEGGRPAG